MNSALREKYHLIRKHTEYICKPLQLEDYVVQPIEDVSPPKWHLAHTTWFFEQFLLSNSKFDVFDKDFAFLFNSYYEGIGERVLRANRGNITRPSVEKIYEYRSYVDKAVESYLANNEVTNEIKEIIELGLQHEQQHQELLLTDIKYILGHNPLFPKYGTWIEGSFQSSKQKFISISEGIYEIGYKGEGFHFDNEKGVHKQYIEGFEISNNLITNREFQEFIDSDGYTNFKYWHAEGWDWVNKNNISAPMYWHKINDQWHNYTLSGLQLVHPDHPVAHISFYEAYAFANWKGMRLPNEFEWEVASSEFDWGQRWEWTNSAYLPYPRFKTASGAIGEYNGKFMVNQNVLRGGSVATSPNHSRNTYRNFFQTNLRWQYTGIRLVKL